MKAAWRFPLPPNGTMPKPRNHIRHIARTFYLSEWWDE
jgi:hypothetical protein